LAGRTKNLGARKRENDARSKRVGAPGATARDEHNGGGIDFKRKKVEKKRKKQPSKER